MTKKEIEYQTEFRDKKVIEYLKEKKGGKFLELGCWDYGFKLCAPFSKEYVGVDVRDVKHPSKYKFLKQDLEKNPKLPFEDQSFDCIIAMDVLEHLNNRHEVMEEIKRLIKKDGLIIISLPNEYSYQPIWYHIKGVEWISYHHDEVDMDNIGHKYFYSIKSAREYVSKHFEIKEEGYFWLNGMVVFHKKISQWLAEHYPRFLARNVLYKCNLIK